MFHNLTTLVDKCLKTWTEYKTLSN